LQPQVLKFPVFRFGDSEVDIAYSAQLKQV
jgi:hypothetical protein